MRFTRRTFVATAAALLAASAVPRAVAKGTGMIFVSTEKGNEVVVLDQSLQVVKRIATSRRPRDITSMPPKSCSTSLAAMTMRST